MFGFLWDSKVGEKFDLEASWVKEKINEVDLRWDFRVNFFAPQCLYEIQ
jgi:hypothetical protein